LGEPKIMELRALIDNERVKGIVAAVVRERLPKIRVVSIEVRDYTDDEDNRLFAIDVVFKGKRSDFDAAMLRALPRYIVAEFDKANEPGFPILSFIAKSEMEKQKADAR
jgi:hypothetical protein